MKNKKLTLTPVFAGILSLGFMMIGTVILNATIDDLELSRKEEILTKYTELYDRVDGLDATIYSLEESYETNIYRIYGRIDEICEDDPDEIRDVVISSLFINSKDSKKLEASILALLENYEEFKTDVEIQTYLNDNVNILESIERYKSVQNGFIKSLEEYDRQYLQENREKEKG